MQSAAARLVVEDLAVEIRGPRGRARAVDGVDLWVGDAESVALVGESGCGKTLTALAVLGLLPRGAAAVRGSVRWNGEDLMRVTPARLREVRGGEIAMIFQEPATALNPILTVGSQIVEAIRAHRPVSRAEAWRRAATLLARVGIPDPERRARAWPNELSGGMKQRVMIAIALAASPRLLIADEPTTALDVTVQTQILDLLDSLRREAGLGLLLIAHDLAVVAERAERVFVMYAGCIVERGSTDRVFTSPAHPYTRSLLAALPGRGAPRSPLTAIGGAVPDPYALPAGCPFRPRCPRAEQRCEVEKPRLRRVAESQDAACHFPEGTL